jgi:predicted nucleotidyltransferase
MQINEQIVQGILRVIIDQFNPCRVILFGSYARNEAGPDSDLDLLIVQDRTFCKKHLRIRETAAIWRALSGYQVPKDILLYSEDEYQRLCTKRNNVVHSATIEGRVLYGTI